MRDNDRSGTRPSGLVPFLCFLLASVAALLFLPGSLAYSASANSDTKARTILLVTLDGARADLPLRLEDAPGLAAVAREGVSLGNATAPTALTFPATVSLLTGLYPHHNGVQDEFRSPLDAKTQTLAQQVSANGWTTAGFPGDYLCHTHSGISRGFGTYLVDAPELSDSARVDSVLAFLRAHPRERCFVWAGFTFAPEHPLWERYLGSESPDSSAYLARARAIDVQIQRLRAGLEQLGLLSQTLFTVVGTHGEAVPGWPLAGSPREEPSLPGNGLDLSEDALRVPWVMRLPEGSGVVTGQRTVADGWVSTVDFAPTILELAGLKAPRPADGISLLSYLRGERLAPRVLYHDADMTRSLGWGPRLAARGPTAKVLSYAGRTAVVPFGDAGAATVAAEAAGLAAALGKEFRIDPPVLPSPAAAAGSAPDSLFAGENREIRLLLEARAAGARRDPKAFDQLSQLAVRYPKNIFILADLTLRRIYRRQEMPAAEAISPILVRQPDLVELEGLYAEHLLFFSRYDVMIDRLRKASVYPMFEADRLWRLAAAHVAAGHAKEADSTYALAAMVGAPPGQRWRMFQQQAGPFAAARQEIKEHPERAEPYVLLGDGLWNLGLFDEGYTNLHQGRGRAPKNPELEYKLGHYLYLEGRPNHAAAAFQRALEKDSTYVAARVELAYAQMQMGENDKALGNLQLAVATGPVDAQAHYNLACLLARKDAKEPALRALEAAVQQGYTNRAVLESDPDLAPLRDDPRFRKILAELP
jgi:tetratricopeptide (TPR) repeat protein